jgi:hypothetical protein
MIIAMCMLTCEKQNLVYQAIKNNLTSNRSNEI